MKNLVLFFVGVFILASLPAEASRVNKRQAAQRARIHQGVKSGELTKREAHKLNQQQRSIRRQEHRAKADGIVTENEAARLEKRQDRASKAIHKNKHDDQERGDNSAEPAAE